MFAPDANSRAGMEIWEHSVPHQQNTVSFMPTRLSIFHRMQQQEQLDNFKAMVPKQKQMLPKRSPSNDACVLISGRHQMENQPIISELPRITQSSDSKLIDHKMKR